MIRRRNPIKRTPIARSTKPIRKRRPGPPRRGPANIPEEQWRNEDYLQFLREEGTCIVEVYSASISCPGECDPMHGPPNGRSQKGPDAGAIPGCRAHHDEQTRIGWPRFESKYGFTREAEALVWWTAFQILQGKVPA